MDELKACGIILCAMIVCVIFRNLRNEYSLFTRLIVTILVFASSLGILYPVLSYIEEIAKNTSIYEYIPTLFKALGVAFMVQSTADACIDAQETSLAERICFFGNAEILLLSLPLIKRLFQICADLIN